MPTEQKERIVEQAREWHEGAAGMVFTDYRGLSVKEMQQLRKQLKAKGAELHVVKNTLFRRALGEAIEQLPAEYHTGPTAVAFVHESESDCAKVLFDYANSHKCFSVKGGFLSGRVFDAKEIEVLSKLPPRDVLIAQVIGTIAAPLSGLVGVIDALVAGPIRTVYAVADKLGAAPAEEAPAEVQAEAAPEAATPTAEAAPSPETPEAPAGEADQAAVSAAEETPSDAQKQPAEAEAASPESEPAEPAEESAGEPSEPAEASDTAETEPAAAEEKQEAAEPEESPADPISSGSEPESAEPAPEAAESGEPAEK